MRCLFVMPTCGKSNVGTGKKVGTFSSRHPLLRPCAHVAPQRTMKEKTMSLLVLHMDKFKKDAVRGIQSHNRRERESHSNPDIDYSRSVGNYDLCGNTSSKYAEAIQNRIDDLLMVKAVRKDAVHLCGLIVSSDTSFFTRIGKDETRRFFKEAAAYLTDFVGRENVISAMVHTDEKTPHMHFLHVPVTPDGRLSANSIYTRASLKKLQTDLPIYLQSRGFDIQRGVEQKPSSAKKHLNTREFKQQQEALDRLILESEEFAQSSRQILDALEQREEELKKSIETYEQQAEEAEKILQGDSSLPKASLFNYQSVLKKASFIIGELKKALAVTHIAQKQKESLQKEVETLRTKQTQLETEYTAHKKQSHEEKDELEAQLKKIKRLQAGYREFLLLPDIRPLHLDFVERKRAEQIQRQQEREQQEQERQETEARQQAEHDQHIRQEPEAVPQRRRSRIR